MKVKLNKEIKLVIVTTVTILLILILCPVFFLNFDFNKWSNFNISNSVVKKTLNVELPKDKKVKLYRKSENKVDEINIEDYVCGVVSSEVPANFDDEALKAQAVAARTYYVNKINNQCKEALKNNAEICDSTHCQVYMDKDTRMESWSKKDGESNWNKIVNAVKSTEGEVLVYDGKVLEYPQFFAVSSGKTENAKDVFSSDIPYLKSEKSEGEEIAPKYKTSIDINIKEFLNKINQKYPNSKLNEKNLESSMKIESYTEGGSVKEIKIGEEKIKGTDFRSLFNLNSSNFTWKIEKNNIKINCIGYGHGVGMSQWGANVMAKQGNKYNEILLHYYSGVEIKKLEYK